MESTDKSIIFEIISTHYPTPRKMKKLILFTILAGIGLFASAQQDAQFTQFMFTKLNINPAYAGTDHAYNAGLTYRDQWLNLPGNPTTLVFNGDAYLPSINSGIGLTGYDDHLGNEGTYEAKLSYSYHIAIGSGILGVGPSIGILDKRLSGTWYTPSGSVYTSTSTILTYDIGLGVYYTNNNGLYFGLSSTHLPQQTIESSFQQFQYTIDREYYLMTGDDFSLSDKWDVLPDLFIESDAISIQGQLNLRVEYNKTIWFGGGYRVNDAFVALIGIKHEFKNGSGIKFGYSYDFTTSNLNLYSSGSHELALQYYFKPAPKTEKE